MSIKGLSDRGLSFPQIGVIKKGSPKQKVQRGDREIEIQGKDLQYFRVEFDEQETTAAELFQQLYGDMPNQLKVTFPFNEIDRVYDAYLEAYTASRLIARSDGERILYWKEGKDKLVKDGLATCTREVKIWKRIDDKRAEPLTVQLREGQPVPYIENMVFHRTEKTLVEAKPVGRLRVTLYELNRLGYLLLTTTSVNDVIALGGPDSGELGSIKAFCDRLNLPFAGVPLILRRKPRQIAYTDKDGKQSRMTRWLVHIEADPEFVKLAFLASKQLAMPAVAMLTAPLPEVAGVNEPEEVDEEETLAPPEDFEEGAEVTAPEPEPVAETPATDAPRFRYNTDQVIGAVKKITQYSTQEAAAAMHQAYKKGRIEAELTIAEAEKFARSLVEPQTA